MASTHTSKEYTGDGSDKTWSYTIQSLKKEDIKVSVTDAGGTFKDVTNFTIPDYSAASGTITFNNTGVDSDVCESDGSPKNDRTIRIYRKTEVATGVVGVHSPRSSYTAGASVKAGDLNDNQKQSLYSVYELHDQEIQETKIRDGAVSRSKIATDAVDGTKIADDAIDSEHYTDLSIDTVHIANDAITVAKIADTQLKDLANNLSSSATELNQLDGKTVTTTFNAGNTNDIPTSSAINSFVVSQLDAVGAFIAIDNEVSFPNAHPDPEDDTGTVVSISDAAGINVDSDGVSTNGRTLGGTTVRITGFPSALQSKSFTEGMGLLVQTTETLNTYTYHKAIAKDSDIISLSETVNSFNNRYRFGTDDPTDSLDDGDLFFNTSQDTFKVYNASDGAWQKTTPTAAQLSNIAICAGNTTYTNDLGLITDAVATSSEGSIDTVADKITEIGRLGTADAVADMAILATTDVVADMNTLATSDIVADLDAVADKATEIGRLGTADAVADLALLGTTAAIADMALLGDSAVIADMALLGDSAVIADMATIADTSNLTTNIGTVAGIQAHVTTVAGISSDVTDVAGKATEIGRLGTADAVADMNTLGTTDIVADLDTCATNVADISAVAGKATEIGRLGTADAVADMAILGTTDVVADLNTLGTAAVVEDLNILGTADVVSDMNTLATTANVNNLNTVAGAISNVNNVGNNIGNVNTVGTSIADVNRYANEYTIASSAPGSPDEGDLWYDSTNNILKYYTGSAWTGISDAGINDLVEDTSPQLGGNLDGQNNSLTSINDIAAVSLDISGNADIDGTLEADAYTVNGTALDEYIHDQVGLMVSDNTESGITVTYEDDDNTLDFVVGTLNQNTTGTAGGLTGTPNITVGDVVAASLDISGNADIDGTMEADAYTVDGTDLDEYIADTVGAMVGSNTESGITVAYQDADNTLDFTVGTLNQDTTGTAAIATTVTVADESSDTTCFPLFSTAATGNLGPKSGSNLTFNSSTGDLTATLLNGGAGANLDLDFGSVA